MQRFGKISLLGLCLVATLALASPTRAAVYISELMYDPEGSDAGREWFEVYNSDDDDIDLSTYSFVEQGTAHRIKLHQGHSGLARGERAVIADKPSAFLIDYPDYTGALYDSSFSLKNTGEELELHNELGEIEFRLFYDSESGGAGNGATLGLINDIWYETEASPGVSNTVFTSKPTPPSEAGQDDKTGQEAEAEQTAKAEETKTSESETIPVDKSPATYIELKNPEYQADVIQVDAGGDRTLMAGVAYYFTGKVYGLQGGPVETYEVEWNWGDGQTGAGKTDRHSYRYSGEYTLTMYASMGRYFGSDRVQVTVIPPALHLVVHPDEPGVVGIYNDSDYHLELSGYTLEQQELEGEYSFPAGTFVNTGNTLYLAPEVFSYNKQMSSSIILADANGYTLDEINPAKLLLAAQIAHKQQAEASPGESESHMTESRESNNALAAGPKPAGGATHSVVYRSASRAEDDGEQVHKAFEKDEGESTLVSTSSQQALVYQGAQERAWSYQTWLMLILLVGGGVTYALIYLRERSKSLVDTIDIIEK